MTEFKTSPDIDNDVDESVSGAYELDLIAFFKVLESDILKILNENKTESVDNIISAINKLLG